ncbi:MAG: RDD family protein [Myxococcales bacterium]
MTDAAEPPSYPPADFRRRVLARVIDLLIALSPLLLVPRGHPRAGEILAAALILCADALFGPGRSLGKRLAGLRVLVLATRRPAGTRESIVRNAIFVLGLLPAVIGAPVLLTAGALACIALLEAIVALQPLTRDLGQRRLGDLFAGTQVIDASIALGIRAPAARETPRAAAPLASRAAFSKEKSETCVSP